MSEREKGADSQGDPDTANEEAEGGGMDFEEDPTPEKVSQEIPPPNRRWVSVAREPPKCPNITALLEELAPLYEGVDLSAPLDDEQLEEAAPERFHEKVLAVQERLRQRKQATRKESTADLDQWKAELPDEPDATDTLHIECLQRPFQPSHLLSFLLQPRSLGIKIPPDNFWLDEEKRRHAYIRYPSVDICRRQRRRLHGAIWPPTRDDNQTLQASYVDPAELEKRKEEEKRLLAEAERLREEDLKKENEAKRARKEDEQKSIDELFQKTTTKPRLFYRIDTTEEGIEAARKDAHRRIQALFVA